jgi:hypothetical protein
VPAVSQALKAEAPSRVERTGIAMSSSTTLITEMAILVGIFLLGLLAKLFPKNGRKAKQ